VSVRRLAAGLRRLWPDKVRWRLTLTYAALFLLAGALLLALTYGLVDSSLSRASNAGPRPAHLAVASKVCEVKVLSQARRGVVNEGKLRAVAVRKCVQAYVAGSKAGQASQRARTLDDLLVFSLIGLGGVALLSGALGWWIAGRVLRPISTITAAARRASDQHLGERVALRGPRDELKELADTFDAMLDRLDAAFSSQRAFIANASHELRTPLTAMRTAIEVTLAKPAPSNEQLRTMAEKIRKGVERSEQLVDALLVLARSENALPPEPVDLAVAVEDAFELSAGEVRERSLQLETALEPAELSGDRVLIERLVGNLVDNAVRHSDSGGSIWVSTGVENGRARLRIANTGPILEPEVVPQLFEPFRRIHERVGTDGLGLGLAIVRAVAVAHGGTVDAAARPDGGLGVIVALPITP